MAGQYFGVVQLQQAKCRHWSVENHSAPVFIFCRITFIFVIEGRQQALNWASVSHQKLRKHGLLGIPIDGPLSTNTATFRPLVFDTPLIAGSHSGFSRFQMSSGRVDL